MGTMQVSRATVVVIGIVFALLLGTGLWWNSRPKGDAAAYSEGVARLEQSDALKKAVEAEEWSQKHPAEAEALRRAYADKAYQPESGSN